MRWKERKNGGRDEGVKGERWRAGEKDGGRQRHIERRDGEVKVSYTGTTER